MSICCLTNSSVNFHLAGSSLNFDDNGVKKLFAINDLEHVIVIGDIKVSYALLHDLVNLGVPITMLRSNGDRIGSMLVEDRTDNKLKVLQHKYQDNPKILLPMRKNTVIDKCRSRCDHLMSLNIKHNVKKVDKSISEIDATIRKLSNCNDIGLLLEYDDLVSRYYFGGLFSIINDSIRIPVATSGGLKKYFDVMLKFGYSILMNQVHTTICTFGFDPYMGYLNSIENNSSALSLDIMSEFSSSVVDSIFMNMLSNKTLTMEHFVVDDDTNAITIKSQIIDSFVAHYESKINNLEIDHDKLKHMSFNQIIKYKLNELQLILINFEEKRRYIKPK